MKKCSKCSEKLDESQFNKRSSAKDGLQPYCRKCSSAAHRDYYSQNSTGRKQRIRERAERQKKIAREYVWNYFLDHPCVDCGESDPVVLEFDHVRGEKVKEVAILISSGGKIDAIKDEIQKCDVRCANCHRKVTSNRGGWWKSSYPQN